MFKGVIQNLCMFILLCPLLFLNIKNSHDWGDDFAQYIHQAKNINEGVSQNETNYIFNNDFFIGPVAYPTGFPLLLSPVIKHYGVNYRVLNVYMSLFLILGCFVGFLLIRKHTRFVTALLTTLVIAYNPTMVNFKTEILSDLPFTFFSLLCLWLITQNYKWLGVVMIGLCIAFTAHIRSIGMILLFVFIWQQLSTIIREKVKKSEVYFPLIAGLSSFALLYLLLKMLFPTYTNYPTLFETNELWLTINDHISYNYDKLYMFFRSYETKNFFYIGVLSSCSLIVFSFLGFIRYFKDQRFSPVVIYMATYLFIVLTFKLGDAGLRFLFPVLPLIFLFAIIGLSHTLRSFDLNHRILPLLFGSLILYSYYEEILKINDRVNEVYEGPDKPQGKEMFAYIQDHLTTNDVVHFDKPRALALYTQVKSFAMNPYTDTFDPKSELNKFKASFLLTNDILTDPKIRNFAQNDTSYCRLICSINEYRLYKLNR